MHPSRQNNPQIRIIGFDADDTLWHNMNWFDAAEKDFFTLMEPWLDHKECAEELYKTEVGNMQDYGYGVKGFTLSMIETACRVSNGRIAASVTTEILEIGKRLINQPIELLDDVDQVLKQLSGRYKAVLITKGDLLDQENKLARSGLEPLFHHIEIMSDKKTANYRKLFNRLEIAPGQFLMVGNSLKSDILPVIELGGTAVHIPYHITWEFEQVTDEQLADKHYTRISSIRELPELL